MSWRPDGPATSPSFLCTFTPRPNRTALPPAGPRAPRRPAVSWPRPICHHVAPSPPRPPTASGGLPAQVTASFSGWAQGPPLAGPGPKANVPLSLLWAAGEPAAVLLRGFHHRMPEPPEPGEVSPPFRVPAVSCPTVSPHRPVFVLETPHILAEPSVGAAGMTPEPHFTPFS